MPSAPIPPAGGASFSADTAGRVRIFDTTLRDGEQAPGCTMTLAEKLDVARRLSRLGVDVIEAGFPAASPGDREAVAAIAAEVGQSDGPIVCGLARAAAADIECCAAAVAPAARQRIHTFLATSDIHLSYKLRISRQEALRRAVEAVALARTFTNDVEFSPEDATRSDPDFLCDVLAAVLEAGATTLNIPDTVGYALPDDYGSLIARVCALAAGWPGVVVSTHCHDDLGLAVANSLAGVRAGARQVECTINGLGERAGNAALEEVVMALHTRADRIRLHTGVDTRQLSQASRTVAACTGVFPPPNKAIVGGNAFAHEAGVHQDGVLKHRATYEIMTPESVGADGTTLVLGKHSGRHALRERLRTMGHEFDDERFREVFERFKELADRKKTIDGRDLVVLVAGARERPDDSYTLMQLQVSSGTHAIPTATVRLRDPDGIARTASATGDGPVDAVCRAVNGITGDVGQLDRFAVRAVTEGIDAMGQVSVRVTDFVTGCSHVGVGAHTDVLIASAEAYLDAVNRLLGARASRATLAPVESTRSPSAAVVA